MEMNRIRDMIWDASNKAGLNTNGESKEKFDETFATSLQEDPDGNNRKAVQMFEEFGKLYTAELVADYERRIETLQAQLDDA